jgi:NurA-like 5'-3' nuclease
MENTQEQKDIVEIKGEIKSIRTHLDNIKKRQDNDDITRSDTNKKIDMIYSSLTDNEFNGNQGYITILRETHRKVTLHELYWRVLLTIILSGGVLAALIKILIPTEK